jgi:hypothetical protein
MTTKAPILFRQGDVLLEVVEALPEAATELPRSKRGVVLAEGEVTGHAHRIPSRSAKLYRTEQDARFLRVMGPAPVALKHEEHTTVELPSGNYRVTIHAEYSPGDLPRQVAD